MSADAQRNRSRDLAKEQDGSNEQSPLLAARTSDDELTLVPPMPTDTPTSPVRCTFDPRSREVPQDARSSRYLFLLTLSMLGYAHIRTKQRLVLRYSITSNHAQPADRLVR